jgi:hypothetical protein
VKSSTGKISVTLGYRKLLFVGTNKSLLLNCMVFF